MKRKWWATVAGVSLVVAGTALAVFLISRDSDERGATDVTRTVSSGVAPAGPAGTAPSASSPSEQKATNDAVAAIWTRAKILRALNNPRLEPTALPEKVASRLKSAAAGEGGQTDPPPASEPRSSKASARKRCKQPRLRQAAEGYPYSRSCYRGSLATPPARVVGQLFFEQPPDGEEYVCTATVALTANSATAGNSSVLVSAGHCHGVPAQGTDESTGQWQPVENMFFVTSPILNRWRVQNKSVAWLEKRAWYPLVYSGTRNPVGYLPTGWMNTGDYGSDFTAIVMGRRQFGGRSFAIAERVGGLPVTMNGAGANRTIRSLGYPAGDPFPGYRLFECVANSSGSGGELGIGCDMTGGSSGGPWLADTNGDGWPEVVSVNSNGPPNIMFGPNLVGPHWSAFDMARRFS